MCMKLRTDKLIANHNANMRMINARTVPITVLPYEPAHMAIHPVENEAMDNAADTVVLEPDNRPIQRRIFRWASTQLCVYIVYFRSQCPNEKELISSIYPTM